MEIGKVIGKGRTADVYEYGSDTVIKMFKPHFSNSEAEKEYKLHMVAQKYSLPVPKLYDVITIGDKKGIVYQRINGFSILDDIRQNPSKMPSYAEDLASLHLEIGSCKIDNDVLETVKSRYVSWISVVDGLENEAKEKVLLYLEGLPEGDSLCHCDFHIDNVLIDSGKYYIIDWLTAAKGCFCTDVMRSYITTKYGSEADDMDITPELKMGIQQFNKIYMDSILKLGRVNLDDVFKWELPVLAARLWEGVPKSEKKVVLERLHQLL